MSGYGKGYDTSNVNVFKSGINDDVTLVKFELVNVDTARYQGEACDIEWQKEGKSQTCRLFPVNESTIRPRSIKEKDASGNQVERMQTEQEAIDEAYIKLNSVVKHIAGCAVTDAEWNEAQKGTSSFADLINNAAKLVAGKNYTGQLILGYKDKYLVVPQAMYVTKSFWSVNGRHQLVFTPKTGYFQATPPVAVQQETKEDTNW